ncbi:MAG: polysaccharide deacetylase family protein [Bacteroidia bacterium]
MNIKQHIANLLFQFDGWRAKRTEFSPPGLRIYVFHSLFADEKERDSGHAFAHEGITLAQFEEFISTLKEQGIRILGPELLEGKYDEKDGPAVLISFDDGYANNMRALPFLERYEVPALFCVVTKNILEQKRFWWDALAETGQNQSMRTQTDISLFMAERKGFLPEENEQWLAENYGDGILTPARETDRPLTVEELKTFASHPLVHIGNHAHSHPIFTKISEERVHEEMRRSQELLGQWLGKAPSVMAWPNGNFSPETEKIAARYGIRYALGMKRTWHSLTQDLPFSPGRVPLYGVRDIASQLTIHSHKNSRWWGNPS